MRAGKGDVCRIIRYIENCRLIKATRPERLTRFSFCMRGSHSVFMGMVCLQRLGIAFISWPNTSFDPDAVKVDGKKAHQPTFTQSESSSWESCVGNDPRTCNTNVRGVSQHLLRVRDYETSYSRKDNKTRTIFKRIHFQVGGFVILCGTTQMQ